MRKILTNTVANGTKYGIIVTERSFTMAAAANALGSRKNDEAMIF
jgi:hypothetical protein